MTDTKDLPGKAGTSPISRQAAYSKAAAHFLEAIETTLELMRKSRNDNVRLGAANKIIDKVLPDLKAAELTGEGGQALRIIIEDYGTTHQPTTETKGVDSSK